MFRLPDPDREPAGPVRELCARELAIIAELDDIPAEAPAPTAPVEVEPDPTTNNARLAGLRTVCRRWLAGHEAEMEARKHAWREIDAHRAGEGREDRNADRKRRYAEVIWKSEGRAVRQYVKHATAEAAQEARKERYRARRRAATPAQKAADAKRKGLARRKESAAKEAERAKMVLF